MTRLNTDVLIVGAGPAGFSAALALSTYGVRVVVITKHRWLSSTPRAHVTNQRTFEILRDLGVGAEAEAQATPYRMLPDAIFFTSFGGEEIACIHSLGAGQARQSYYALSSPCEFADLAQNLLEPILLKGALSRGAEMRFSTEYLSSKQDAKGVTATLRDRTTDVHFEVRAQYMIGADGGRSKVVEELKLPMEGEMDFGGSVNILMECDLSRHVSFRPAVLYFIVRNGFSSGGVELGFLRPTRRWNQWLFTKGYAVGQARPRFTHEEAINVVRDYLDDPDLQISILAVDPWSLNSMYATRYSERRIFCVGDAVHRHAPSNGLGSNTCIGDSYNLAWKLALVVQGKAAPSLLGSYDAERIPVGTQVVKRATKSLTEYGAIFAALGLAGAETPEQGIARMEELKQATPEAALRRQQLRDALAAKQYEFNAHGVKLNQRYVSSAVLSESSTPPSDALDEELYYTPTTSPGARVPHVWLQQDGRPVSTLDLVGKGCFTVLTGIGGEVWTEAAAHAATAFQVEVAVYTIGYGSPITDLYNEWVELREVSEAGCLLIRPDGHVAWRAQEAPGLADEAVANLHHALSQILGRSS